MQSEKMNTRLFLLFITVAIFTTGCLNNERNNLIIEAEFNIDSTLLMQQPFIDSLLNLSIFLPRNWVMMDLELENSIKNSVHSNDYENSKLLIGCINKKDTSTMILLDISKIDPSVFSVLKNNYEEVINANNVWSEIQFQEFVYNCFRIEQYVFQNDRMLNFKLICYEVLPDKTKSPKFELLYFINRKYLSENIKSVESSIGSIECLTN